MSVYVNLIEYEFDCEHSTITTNDWQREFGYYETHYADPIYCLENFTFTANFHNDKNVSISIDECEYDWEKYKDLNKFNKFKDFLNKHNVPFYIKFSVTEIFNNIDNILLQKYLLNNDGLFVTTLDVISNLDYVKV